MTRPLRIGLNVVVVALSVVGSVSFGLAGSFPSPPPLEAGQVVDAAVDPPAPTATASAAFAPLSPGRLVVTPTTIAFPATGIFTESTRLLTIKNTGQQFLDGTVRALARPFAVTAGAGSFHLAPGAERKVEIEFAPTVAGAASRSLLITSNDPSRAAFTVPVTGTATSPTFAITGLHPVSVAPMGWLIINGTFAANVRHSVRFFDNAGFSVDVPAGLVTTTQLMVGVPPYVDVMTGRFTSGPVSVVVMRESEPIRSSNRLSGLTIANLPTSTARPGTATLSLLSGGLDRLVELQNDLIGSPLDAPGITTPLAALIIETGRLVADVRAVRNDPLKSFSLGRLGGPPVRVTSEHLRVLDRLILGMLQAQAGAAPDAALDLAPGAICAGPEARDLLDDLKNNRPTVPPSQLYWRAVSNCTPTAGKTALAVVGGSGGVAVSGMSLASALGLATIPEGALALPTAALLMIKVEIGGWLIGVGAALRSVENSAGLKAINEGIKIFEGIIRNKLTNLFLKIFGNQFPSTERFVKVTKGVWGLYSNTRQVIAAVSAGDEVFTGTFGGPLGTATSAAGCGFAVAVAASMKLTLTQNGTGAVSGTAEVPTNFNISVTFIPPNTSCTASSFAVTATGPVSGTNASLTGTFRDDFLARPTTIRFFGTRTGSAIVGSATVTRTFLITGTGGDVFVTMSATYSNFRLQLAPSSPAHSEGVDGAFEEPMEDDLHPAHQTRGSRLGG
jgi:hypothetical protein